MPSSFFKDPATPEISPLSLHDALPICRWSCPRRSCTTASGSTPSATRSPSARCRSEEHTSELQSQFHLVCRLLFLRIRPPPRSPLFPYTTLFRSAAGHARGDRALQRVDLRRPPRDRQAQGADRKSTRLNSSHSSISYAVFFF